MKPVSGHSPIRVQLTVNQHDGDLLPPLVVQRLVFKNRSGFDFNGVGDVIGKLGNNLLDDAFSNVTQVAAVFADQGESGHTSILCPLRHTGSRTQNTPTRTGRIGVFTNVLLLDRLAERDPAAGATVNVGDIMALGLEVLAYAS